MSTNKLNLVEIWVWDFDNCFLIDVCKRILTLTNTHIVYGAAEEYSFPHKAKDNDAVAQILPSVKQHMAEHNVTLDFISTANNVSEYSYLSINKFKLWEIFNLISWQTSTMLLARHNFEQHVHDYEFTQNKKYPYVCLNNNPGGHRDFLIDYMAKHKCIDQGLWSFRSPSPANVYRWWTPCKMKLPEGKRIKLWKGLGPLQYNDAFCDIVCETDAYVPHYTEKTARPLYLEIPFLIVGCRNANNKLKEYGFELYNEIWDYEFDSIDHLETRISHIAPQIKNLCDLSTQQRNALYKEIQPKLKHNKEVFMQIEHHNIPPTQAYQFSRYRETLLSGLVNE